MTETTPLLCRRVPSVTVCPELPSDVLGYIFSLLDEPEDIFSACLVCASWCRAIKRVPPLRLVMQNLTRVPRFHFPPKHRFSGDFYNHGRVRCFYHARLHDGEYNCSKGSLCDAESVCNENPPSRSLPVCNRDLDLLCCPCNTCVDSNLGSTMRPWMLAGIVCYPFLMLWALLRVFAIAPVTELITIVLSMARGRCSATRCSGMRCMEAQVHNFEWLAIRPWCVCCYCFLGTFCGGRGSKAVNLTLNV